MENFLNEQDFEHVEEYFGESVNAEDQKTIAKEAKELYDAILNPKNAKRLAVAIAVYKLAYGDDIDLDCDMAADYQDSVVNGF